MKSSSTFGSGRAGQRLGVEILEDRSLLSGTPMAPVIDLGNVHLSQEYDASQILVRYEAGALVGGAPTASRHSPGRRRVQPCTTMARPSGRPVAASRT